MIAQIFYNNKKIQFYTILNFSNNFEIKRIQNGRSLNAGWGLGQRHRRDSPLNNYHTF